MAVVIFIATHWGTRHGGVNSFNQDLVRTVAACTDMDVDVACAVTAPTPEAVRSAAAERVTLLNLGQVDPGGGFEDSARALVQSWTSRWRQIDWFVGHDLVSGRFAVEAATLAGAQSAVVLHTAYGAYASFRGTVGKNIHRRDSLTRETLVRADAVFAVGPKLTRTARDHVDGKRDVIQLVPGLGRGVGRQTQPENFHAITSGRLDALDDRLKQGSLAVAAFGHLARTPYLIGPDPRISVVGAEDGKEGELRQLAAAEADRLVAVNCRGYEEDREQIQDLLRTTSACLMLSVHDGFGLTGWEALSAGVPLVLSKNTGLHELLAEVGGEATGCVRAVEIQGSTDEPYYTRTDVTIVSDALGHIAGNGARAKQDARTLRARMSEHTWPRAARELLNALRLRGRMPVEEDPHILSSTLATRTTSAGIPNRLLTLSRTAAAEAGRAVSTGPGLSAVALVDLYVPRTLESRLWTRTSVAGATVVTGEPGMGKTSVLWHLAERLRSERRPFLFLRAADLTDGPSRAGSIALDEVEAAVHWLGTGGPEPDRRPPAVLVDTIDLMVRSTTGQALLADLLARLAENDVAVVMTCRDQEFLELQFLLRPGDDGEPDVRLDELKLAGYDDQELEVAVERHALHLLREADVDVAAVHRQVMRAATRGLPLREIVVRPLTLRMLFETQQELLVRSGRPQGATAGDDLPGLDELDISDLYDRYWDLRVRSDRRTGSQDAAAEADHSEAAELAAVVMLSHGRPAAERQGELEREVGCRPAPMQRERLSRGLEELVRRQVLVGLREGAAVEFFHQTFFEYAAARALERIGAPVLDDLVDQLSRHPNDLFLAAVVQQFLVRTCMRDVDALEAAFDGFFARLLMSESSAQQQLGITAYALARHRGPLTVVAARVVMGREEGLARRFMYFLPRVAHPDMTSVLGDLREIWDSYDAPRPGTAGEARVAVLESLAACAAQAPDEVRSLFGPGRWDWLTWFESLDLGEAQSNRSAPLGLIEAIGEDQTWALQALRRVVRAVTRDGPSRDALAAAVGLGVRVLRRPAELRALLEAIPDDPVMTKPSGKQRTNKPSGLEALRASLAGVHHRLWSAEGIDPVALAGRLAHDAVPGPGERQGSMQQAAWVALAELAMPLSEAAAANLMSVLLGQQSPDVRTLIAERTLPRLIEGEFRARLPGMTPTSSPVDAPPMAVVAREHCGRLLLQLPAAAKDPVEGRNIASAGRDALCQARIPGELLARILESSFGPAVPAPLWLDENGLAALLPAAALGGHPVAQRILSQWADGESDLSSPKVHKIVAHRLALLAQRGAEQAWKPLIQHARTNRTVEFLRRELEHAGDAGRILPASCVEAATQLSAELVRDRDQHRRGDGYALLAELQLQPDAPAVSTGVIVDALKEKQVQVVKKAITMTQRVVDTRPETLGATSAYTRVESRLRRWLTPGGSATPEVVTSAHRALGDLVCRSGPLDAESREKTTVEARQLCLGVGDSKGARSFWYLVSRLAAVDANAASAEVVHAARTVHDWPGRSWRPRWALAGRRALEALASRLDTEAWLALIHALASPESALLPVAVQVGVEHRREPDADIDELLTEAAVEGATLMRLSVARSRRDRRQGTSVTWPELLSRHRNLAAAR